MWGYGQTFFLSAKENVRRTHAEQNKKKTVYKNVNARCLISVAIFRRRFQALRNTNSNFFFSYN
jgi:hypothetical protein